MPDLEPVRQDITADADEYLRVFDECIAKAEEFARAAQDAEEAALKLGISARNAAELLGSLERTLNDVVTSAGGAAREVGQLGEATARLAGSATIGASAERNLADASADLMQHTALLISIDEHLAAMQRDVADSSADLMMMNQLLSGSFDRLSGQLTGVIAHLALLRAALDISRTSTTRAAGGWRIWGVNVMQALHWIVMGTLEIASTAIPALVAFGAAAAGMYPTIIRISDSQNNLLTASTGVRSALLNSVGPLHNLAMGYGTLSRAMAPDAYVIFGSIISGLSGHMSQFSGVARQAGTVLANFASKLSAELSGPLGSQLAGFFSNAVKYMIQWGQFLGNIGHTFVNVMGAMWGVGQLLLDVLNGISKVLLAISSNPAGAFFIGLLAAMSAVYRYGKLLVTIFNWLGGTALVNAIKWAVGYGSALAALAAEEGVVAAAAVAMGDLITFALGPVGIAIAAIGAAIGVWYLATRNQSDATDNLISRVQKMPPSVANATKGISELESNLNSLHGTTVKQSAEFNTAMQHMGRFGTSLNSVSAASGTTANDINKTIKAIRAEAQELINLDYGMAQAGMRTGQVGAGMNALEVQTALADSKVTQLNQAIDQYIGLLTGGTGAEAAFTTSMSNLTTGTNKITNVLGSSGSVTLSVNQFAQALTHMNQTGAQAWTNFNQVLGSSMPQLLDWFRQAGVLGAATGQDVSSGALDMAKSLVPLAADSKTAQAQLLGVLRAQGLNVKSFPELKKMVDQNGVGMKDLTKRVDDTTKAMSNLSQMAQNAATALNTQVSQAIAQAALQSSGFNTDLKKLQTDMQNQAPANVIHSDIAKVNGDLKTAQQRAIQTGNGIQSGMSTASRAMDGAKRHARELQDMFDAMHGFNISNSVTTTYQQVGGPSMGLPYGTVGKATGAEGGFVKGPGTSHSDSVSAMLSHGEYVMSAAAVSRYGKSTFDAMNARHFADGGSVTRSPAPPVLIPSGGGGGSGPMFVNVSMRADLMVGSQRLGSANRTESLVYQRRNPQTNYSLLHR